MKFNSILLIIFCLLQALNNSTVGLNEQSLKDAAVKTLQNSKVNHQESFKLESKGSLVYDPKLSYSPLTSDNIQFRFDEYGLLYIKYVNLNITASGSHKFNFYNSLSSFTARLDDFSWEQSFVVLKNDLDNGKLDIQFKSNEESEIKFNVTILPYGDKIKDDNFYKLFKNYIKLGLENHDFNPLKIKLRKISQLILETVQSDLK